MLVALCENAFNFARGAFELREVKKNNSKKATHRTARAGNDNGEWKCGRKMGEREGNCNKEESLAV